MSLYLGQIQHKCVFHKRLGVMANSADLAQGSSSGLGLPCFQGHFVRKVGL